MRTCVAILSVLFLSGLAVAQVQSYGENESALFQDNRSMGGPTVGVKFIAPNPEVVTRLEVFTGEATGQNTIALYTHDAGLNQPGTPIVQASWFQIAANSWQGANLAQPTPISAGTTYWLVWTPVGGSQASWELNGPQTQQYRGFFPPSWNGPFNGNWKFRIFSPRAITPTGTPRPGANVSLGISAVRDGNLNYVMAGSLGSVPGIPLAPDGRPIPLNVDAFLFLSLSTPSIFQNFLGTLDATGSATATLALPPIPSLVGLQFWLAYVTLQTESSSGIKSISDPLLILVLP